MALTPDRKKSALVGVGLTAFGLILLSYGTWLLPVAHQQQRLFGGIMLVIFGFLLALSAVLIFVLPAAYDYMDEAVSERREDWNG